MLKKQIMLRMGNVTKYDIYDNITEDLQLEIFEKIDKNFIEVLHNTCTWCGYFISNIIYKKDDEKINFIYDYDKLNELNYNSNYWYFQIERNTDDKIIYSGILYHVTKKEKIIKIKEIGLCPKSSKKISNYPHRIYVCQNKKCTDSMLKQLKKDKEMCIIEIIVNNIELYKDPNSEGNYILCNIQPNYIRNIYNENWISI